MELRNGVHERLLLLLLHLFGEAVHAQTVRFCPRLEESDPGGGDDGGGSWYDYDQGEPPDDLGGAYDTTRHKVRLAEPRHA